MLCMNAHMHARVYIQCHVGAYAVRKVYIQYVQCVMLAQPILQVTSGRCPPVQKKDYPSIMYPYNVLMSII